MAILKPSTVDSSYYVITKTFQFLILLIYKSKRYQIIIIILQNIIIINF